MTRDNKRDKTEFVWKGNRLYIGRRYTGLELIPDEKYPQMWRVKYKDTVSDMVNRTRAKDAAFAIFRMEGAADGQGGALETLKSVRCPT